MSTEEPKSLPGGNDTYHISVPCPFCDYGALKPSLGGDHLVCDQCRRKVYEVHVSAPRMSLLLHAFNELRNQPAVPRPAGGPVPDPQKGRPAAAIQSRTRECLALLTEELRQAGCGMSEGLLLDRVVERQLRLEGTLVLHSETARRNGGDYDFDYVCVVEGVVEALGSERQERIAGPVLICLSLGVRTEESD